MVTFGSHVGNHQFQPFLSGVYAGVISSFSSSSSYYYSVSSSSSSFLLLIFFLLLLLRLLLLLLLLFFCFSLRLPPSVHINLPWGNLSPLPSCPLPCSGLLSSQRLIHSTGGYFAGGGTHVVSSQPPKVYINLPCSHLLRVSGLTEGN